MPAWDCTRFSRFKVGQITIILQAFLGGTRTHILLVKSQADEPILLQEVYETVVHHG